MKTYKILTLLFLCTTNIVLGDTNTIDKIIALVNHHIILDSDVRKKLNIQQNHLSKSNQYLSTITSLYQETLNQLIANNLIFNAANQENIVINHNQINQTINDIAHLHNMTFDQFQAYLRQIDLNYEKYYLQIHQEMINNIMCNHIVHQRANILPNEISDLVQTLYSIDYHKEFKITHIILPLPIQPTQYQIKTAENLAQALITSEKFNENISKLIYTHNPNNHIFQTIKIQKTSWISWKNIPIIFDQYLQNCTKNDIIGPILSHDGLHILKIRDTRYKHIKFPITKVKLKTLILQNNHIYTDPEKKLLKIKKYVENGNITFDIIAKKKSKDSHVIYHIEDSQWNYLDNFEPKIKQTVFTLKKHEISNPINTTLGWCLIQLMDINTIDYSTMIRERAYAYLLHKKFNKIINNWIQELKTTAYIKIIYPND